MATTLYHRLGTAENATKKRDLQLRVRERFYELQATDKRLGWVPWHVINATKMVEDVREDVNAVAEAVIDGVKGGKSLYKMLAKWEYRLDEGEMEVEGVGSSGTKRKAGK